jgi:hypothetical protein
VLGHSAVVGVIELAARGAGLGSGLERRHRLGRGSVELLGVVGVLLIEGLTGGLIQPEETEQTVSNVSPLGRGMGQTP